MWLSFYPFSLLLYHANITTLYAFVPFPFFIGSIPTVTSGRQQTPSRHPASACRTVGGTKPSLMSGRRPTPPDIDHFGPFTEVLQKRLSFGKMVYRGCHTSTILPVDVSVSKGKWSTERPFLRETDPSGPCGHLDGCFFFAKTRPSRV